MNVVCKCGSDNTRFQFGCLSQRIEGWKCLQCGHRSGAGDDGLPLDAVTSVAMIAEERARQINAEGWSASHDDEHIGCQLIDAASSYAWAAGKQVLREEFAQPFTWPWEPEWWRPADDPVRNLVKAGALIAAEIDRLQRKRAVAKAREALGSTADSTLPDGENKSTSRLGDPLGGAPER